MKSLDLKWLRSTMGLVGQEPVLVSQHFQSFMLQYAYFKFDTTIEENVCIGASEGSNPTSEDIQKVLEMANASSFVSRLPLGVQTRAGERG